MIYCQVLSKVQYQWYRTLCSTDPYRIWVSQHNAQWLRHPSLYRYTAAILLSNTNSPTSSGCQVDGPGDAVTTTAQIPRKQALDGNSSWASPGLVRTGILDNCPSTGPVVWHILCPSPDWRMNLNGQGPSLVKRSRTNASEVVPKNEPFFYNVVAAGRLW